MNQPLRIEIEAQVANSRLAMPLYLDKRILRISNTREKFLSQDSVTLSGQPRRIEKCSDIVYKREKNVEPQLIEQLNK